MRFNFGAQFTAAQLQAGLESEVANSTHTCEISTLGVGPGIDFDGFDIESLLPDLSQIPTTIGAGEVITFTSPAGTFASLVSTQMFGFFIVRYTGCGGSFWLDSIRVNG